MAVGVGGREIRKRRELGCESLQPNSSSYAITCCLIVVMPSIEFSAPQTGNPAPPMLPPDHCSSGNDGARALSIKKPRRESAGTTSLFQFGLRAVYNLATSNSFYFFG